MDFNTIFLDPGKVTCLIFCTWNENYRKIHGNLPGDKIYQDKQKTLYIQVSGLIVQTMNLYEPEVDGIIYQNISYLRKNLSRFIGCSYCILLYLPMAIKKVM